MNQSNTCRKFSFNYNINNNNNNIKCTFKILQSIGGYNTAIDLMRIVLLLFYLIWIIIAFKIKEFHKRQMIFVYNLVVVGIFHCLTGLWPRLWSTCYTPTQLICVLIQWTILYGCYYSGYAIGGLILYRLACILYLQNITQIKLAPLLMLVSLTWLIPFILSLINLFAFDHNIYYHRFYGSCFLNTFNGYKSFCFFLIFANLLPIIIISVVYFYVYHKLNLLTNSNRRKEPLRITIQMIILILFYIASCIASLLAYYPCFAENSKPIVIHWLRMAVPKKRKNLTEPTHGNGIRFRAIPSKKIDKNSLKKTDRNQIPFFHNFKRKLTGSILIKNGNRTFLKLESVLLKNRFRTTKRRKITNEFLIVALQMYF
jgi:hypothetical protein